MNPSLSVEKEDKNTHLKISYIENGLFHALFKFPYDDMVNGIIKRKEFIGDIKTNSKEKIKNIISAILIEDYRGLKDGLLESMKVISVPCLLLWGENDTIVPSSVAQKMKEVISGARLEIVTGADHGLPFRNPKVFAEHLTAFVRSL